MIVNKTTRYALYAVMEMARLRDQAVTVSQVAEKYAISAGVLAKVFQQLVRAGLAQGTRGVGGGYRLVENAKKITVLRIIEIFEPPVIGRQCLMEHECSQADLCRLRELFDEVDQTARDIYGSTNLETLVRR